MALAKARKTYAGSSSNNALLHEMRLCPECSGTDRRESKPGNVLTCCGCGYRVEVEAVVQRTIASSKEH